MQTVLGAKVCSEEHSALLPVRSWVRRGEVLPTRAELEDPRIWLEEVEGTEALDWCALRAGAPPGMSCTLMKLYDFLFSN